MPDMRAYPRYLPRYPISESDMKNPYPIRSRFPIFRTLVRGEMMLRHAVELPVQVKVAVEEEDIWAILNY